MISLIFAQSSNGYIGKDGDLLFQIPADMKRFRQLTTGKIVIMGRKTWESLPPAFRPLPNRRNIVLSRTPFFLDGADTATSLEAAVRSCKDFNMDICIIGGEQVYKEGMKYADEIHQTLVDKDFDGDAKAPFIDLNKWNITYQSPPEKHEDFYYQFLTYRK